MGGADRTEALMTIDDVFDLLEHAIEPETWQCDDAWEYRAMHWRPRAIASRQGLCEPENRTGNLEVR
jgi:hypothetical protein